MHFIVGCIIQKRTNHLLWNKVKHFDRKYSALILFSFLQLDTIIQPITVEHCPISLDDWSMMGGTIESIVTPTTHIADQEYVYWYRHFYDPSCAR